MEKIYYWPCGTWCRENHIEEYNWMSDDFGIMNVPDTWSDHEVNLFINDNS
jgi:hypothetical protein